MSVWNTHTRVRRKKQFTQICDSSVDDLQSHNRSPDQSDQDSCTPESSTLFYHVVLSLVSPLLDGPFLISPSRRQRATPGDSHTRTRSKHSIKNMPACAALAPWLPQGRLRGEVPAELERETQKSPSLESPSRFTRKSVSNIFLLIEYPHTTLSPVTPRRLSTRAKLQTLSILSGIYIS